MSSDAFRAAFEAALGPSAGPVGEKIIALSEMEAVRQFIGGFATVNGLVAADRSHLFWRLPDGSYMPQSVIDWVFDDGGRRGS